MTPMPDQPAAAPDASAAAPDAESSAGSEGYEICLCVYADGTFAVHKDPLESPSQEQAEGEGNESEQHVTSFEDALKAAVQIYKANPVQASEQASFESGFGKPKESY